MDFQTASFGEKIEWPYSVNYDRVNRISIDVLVVGGGHAGSCAAISAARRGAKVAVCDKAPIKRAGCGGAGQDHWNTILDNPFSPVTPEENIEKASDGSGQGHREYIAIKGSWDALLELEKMGMPIRDEDGEFKGQPQLDIRTQLLKGYDYENLVAVKLRGGHYIKPILYNEMLKLGVEMYERIMITSLLTEGGKFGATVIGAMGFSMTSGEFYVFSAKSVIIATGYACSLWTMSMELTGNSFRWDPNEVGEGMAMAWNAGADAMGVFKNGGTNGAHPFAWPRFGVGNPYNTWFPCTIVDNTGKEIPWEDLDGNRLENVYDRTTPGKNQPYIASHKSDAMPRNNTPSLVKDLPKRIEQGEFQLPLWADLPSMPEAERRSIWGVMIGNEGKSRYTLYDLYTRSGFNPDRDMLMAPIMEPAGYKSTAWFHGEPNAAKTWRSENGGQGEIACDWKLMTSLPGLFAAGASIGLEGCSFACASGFYVGNRAVEFAACSEGGMPDEKQIEKERSRVYAPARRSGEGIYISWKELWAGTARVMQQCCAGYKTVPILKQGLMWLDSIRRSEALKTFARNPHELARVMECETRITVSEAILNAAILKIEAEERGEDAENLVFRRSEDGHVEGNLRPRFYWLQAPHEPTYSGNYNRSRTAERCEE